MTELLLAGKEPLAPRLALAAELGHTEALLLFTRHDKKNADAKALAPKGLRVRTAILVRDRNQARSLKKLYDCIVARAKRELIEEKAVTHILEPEGGSREDFLHHRNSGLNQVTLKLCQTTKKEILTTLALLGKEPQRILGRMMQNARFCRKYKVPYHVTSGAAALVEQRDAEGLAALRRTLTQ